MAVLLTGLGYVGAALAQRLAERGERVVALENFFCTRRESLAHIPAHLIEGDVARPSDVARLFDAAADASVVFHLAAQPSAAIAVRDPETTERTNLTGSRIVLQAAADRGIPVVFGGSFRVYGDAFSAHAIVTEETPYGRVGDLSHLSKIYVEQLARMVGGEFVSVRLGVVYGLSPVMKTVPAFMTVPNLFCQRAACGEVLQVHEDRPMAFVHVGDAVDALLLAADRVVRTGGYQIVNAAPEVVRIGHLARVVQQLAQARGRSVRIQSASASQACFCVSSNLERFQPMHAVADSLGEVLDFFLEAA